MAEKEKEDTESHKIDELYEFSNDSSLDEMFWKINSQENWGEFERVPLFIYTTM